MEKRRNERRKKWVWRSMNDVPRQAMILRDIGDVQQRYNLNVYKLQFRNDP